jgi:hypothetical protein
MKEINIPNYLQDLHGKRTSIFVLILTYLSGLVSATVITYFIDRQLNVDLWRQILAFVLLSDISGGIISNYSESTRKHYRENSKKRIVFVFLHLLHPVLFIVIFPKISGIFLFMGIYALSCCLAIHKVTVKEYKRVLSAFLFVIGVLIVFIFDIPIDIIRIIPILFFVKLILAHSNSGEN